MSVPGAPSEQGTARNAVVLRHGANVGAEQIKMSLFDSFWILRCWFLVVRVSLIEHNYVDYLGPEPRSGVCEPFY